ncbi:LOW QUALITY PROTEIN: multidrug resistance-associated protein 1-like [Paramacrobiotus metropolitanus]|uniref:LOW QUALITY PROTEIN: multidrug resistance-associated protein 1-like n=1 Tax=Paramacrobiotus metropolitanus TaxID=2943436 RepID=UPI002445CBF0|nr:LOW QUALITY PROTEIN: multidrug resistance-associated protein 1-like [Paramacrobiotus metropolitanus]
MAVDTQKFIDLAHSLHSLWASPLQVGICLYFLYQQLGVSIFAGLGFMILLVPINTVTAIAARKFQVMQMKEKDKRMKLTNEALKGIKVLKLYAWEDSFEKQILDIRENEMRSIQKVSLLTSMTFFLWTVSPFLVALVTFATYIFMDQKNVLDTQRAFVSLSLFNILRQPLTDFRLIITSLVQARVSIDRMATFLTKEELDPDNVRLLAKTDPTVGEAVLVKNGEFAWDQKDASTLQSVNVQVTPGQLVAVVGKVGAGKSSLVSAMLGMMEKKRGEVIVKGTISCVNQQAWLQNMTVQQNILFGKPMDRERYDRVVKCCALEPDLLILQNGDRTPIGEKGLNLSGGQKQRISLARAVYADADVCFLDDPLSAVDADVGEQLFEEVIGPKGLLAGKTRIFVTHGVSFLPQADNILVIEDGRIAATGTYKTLLNNNGSFSALLRSYLPEKAEGGEADTVSLPESVEPRSKTSSTATLRKVRRTFSKISQRRSSTVPEKVPEKQVKPDAALVEEEMEVGNVKWRIFVSYMRCMTYPVFFSMIAAFSAYNALNLYTNVWLGDWSENAESEERYTDPAWRDYQLRVYGGIGGALVLAYVAACSMYAVGQVYASGSLHRGMLRRVLHAPLAFFDTTPLGRVINRFSKDIEAIDMMLPSSLMIFLSFAISVLATIIFLCVIIPYFAAVIVPLAVVYFFIQRFYIATSRQLKRLDNASRSPIFSHLEESLAGTTMIIATRQTERFMHENDEHVDNNNKAAYANLYSQRWVAVMLDFMGNLITLFAAIFVVVGRGNNWVAPKNTGIILSYTLSVTSLLNWLVRMTSEVENYLVSVERVQEYTEIAQEADWVRHDKRPPKNWPHEGKVVFDNYQARYRPELELVLTDINADISAGEKIGIVGRTGAGKSSLTLALFRIVEPAGGSVIIDNIDLVSMGLHDVRSHLTIIPQEPVLFSGTLRMNLDPFDKYTDEAVWQALQDSQLKTFVSSLTDHLQHVVAEGGENLSVGQRQLLCLARALLKKTKILVMDEATAAIDLQTEGLIQKTIREKFVDCTVLTIAHRLNTVMDSTRIMVMDQGKIVEFAPPAEMLRDTNSGFYSLAKQAGLV